MVDQMGNTKVNDFNEITKRVNKTGITLTQANRQNKSLTQTKGYIVFNNRRIKKSVVLDEKKLCKLLGVERL